MNRVLSKQYLIYMKKIFFALFTVSLLTGCLKSSENTFTCNYDGCAYKAPASEIQQVSDYLAANNITATQHCSGLFYIIDAPGSGTAPTACSNIAFTYVGKLTDGTTFDQATEPVAANISQLIGGFKNALPLIKAGGKIRLYIPPSLGYGDYPPTGSGIPAKAMLIFEVGLAGVQ